MKKEASAKLELNKERAKRSSNVNKTSDENKMHDIDRPITLEDLTNPDNN